MSISDDAELCSYSIETDAAHIVSGKLACRVDSGNVTTTAFYLEVTAVHVLLRYDDGIVHIGHHGDDIIKFFNGLFPSLLSVAS